MPGTWKILKNINYVADSGIAHGEQGSAPIFIIVSPLAFISQVKGSGNMSCVSMRAVPGSRGKINVLFEG